ncbi:30S ribosomal protein S4e [Candidatus Woesearchaeota archaeon]|nr:30S ribosomal protein S4e [Candidatus Woesearchaeota archaeon]
MSHVKRIAAPGSWMIKRKENKYISRPMSGKHALQDSLSLVVVLRDFLGLAKTSREVKKILLSKEILVDGRKVKESKSALGLFDVLSIPETKEHYRILMDEKGRLAPIKIDEKESKVEPCKVIGKRIINGGKTQLNLYDGKNILSEEKDIKTGDTLLISLPELKINKHWKAHKGAAIFLIDGSHQGETGELVELQDEQAVFLINGKKVQTSKNYVFVIGENKPEIKLK